MVDLTKLTPLIDADTFIYRVGFVTEDEPVEYAMATIRESMNHLYEVFSDPPALRKIYLTGKGNFRDRVATIQEYKGNRVGKAKPRWYNELRKYLVDHHGAFVIEGQEADDAIGIEQWKNKDRTTCIVSSDKDLRTVPGHHFHPIKLEYSYVTLAEANKNFWTQVLTGDTSDHIQGIPKVGPKTAEKVIAETDGSWTSMAERVLQEYRRVFKDEAEHHFHENATLLWIRREDGINYDGRPFIEIERELQEG